MRKTAKKDSKQYWAIPETFSGVLGPYQKSMIELFWKIVNGL